jgi:hypothetical protein
MLLLGHYNRCIVLLEIWDHVNEFIAAFGNCREIWDHVNEFIAAFGNCGAFQRSCEI